MNPKEHADEIKILLTILGNTLIVNIKYLILV